MMYSKRYVDAIRANMRREFGETLSSAIIAVITALFLIAAMIVIVNACHAQQTPTIVLSPADAASAKAAWQAFEKAEKLWHTEEARIRAKYAPAKDPGTVMAPDLWSCGLSFSTDFLIAVPKCFPTTVSASPQGPRIIPPQPGDPKIQTSK